MATVTSSRSYKPCSWQEGKVERLKRTAALHPGSSTTTLTIASRPATREHPLGLTRREDEILKLLSEGMTNDEIATKLVLSTRTVDHHVSAVLTKLGVSSRGAAAAEARRRDLV
jgi:DNA-binding NarL/FixJ family response regulator